MRAKWISICCSLGLAAVIAASYADTPGRAPSGDVAGSDTGKASDYIAYETAARADGCRWVYIVRRPLLVVLPAAVPTPLQLRIAAGLRGASCADGSWRDWQQVDIDAEQLTTPHRGAITTQLKLFSGDFDGDGREELLLQAGDRLRDSLILALDMRGAPRVFRNLRHSLSAAEYPAVAIADLNRNGRADIVATNANGQVFTYADGLVEAAIQRADTAATNRADITAASATAVSFNVTLAGRMDGKFKVDESGAATYELPILAVRGTAGLTPRISLNYSSSADDGVAGPGWSIGGLSAITRCRQTLAQDNNSTAISLNADDRFCLDGQRLVLVSGIYGGNGSTYRTEIDSYAVVTAYGARTGHPGYFTVRRKDGSLSYYGDGVAQGINRSAPAIDAGGSILTWAISRLEDSVGNAIRFQYYSDSATNEHLINRIDYAYGANTGASGNSGSFLQFNYENRPDSSSGYVAGAKITRAKRLASIRSTSDFTELRTYNLVYRAADAISNRSLVERIYECFSRECLTPTAFEWQLNRGGFAPAQMLADEAWTRLSTLRVLDIDGDGRSDLLYRKLTPPYPLVFRLAQGSGFGPTLPLLSSTVKVSNVDEENVAIFDQNGDGRQDVLHVAPGTGVYKGTLFLGGSGGFLAGTALDPAMAVPVAADIDSDGLPDLVGSNLLPIYRSAQRVVSGGMWATIFSRSLPLLGNAGAVPGPPPGCNTPQAVWYLPAGLLSDGADFNGDARVDFAAQARYSVGTCKADHAGAAISQGGGAFTTRDWVAGVAGASIDVNGDGLADQWYDDPVGYRRLRFSTGSSFTAPLQIGLTGYLKRGLSADYNGDGFIDVLWPSGYGVLMVQLFDPATQNYGAAIATALPFQWGSGVLADDRYIPLDIDGDGHTDLLRINQNVGGSSLTLYRSIDSLGAGNRIVRIDNGAGLRTAISYKPLTDTGVYTPGKDAANATAWPGAAVFDVVAPHYVVAGVESSAPAAHPGVAGAVDHAAVRSTSYQYGGLKVQSGGRGSLGFAWIKTTDGQTGITSRTSYRQDFPFTGRPVWTLVASGSGVLTRSIAATSAQIVRSGVGGARYYQLYDSRQDELNHDPVSGIEVGYVTSENDAPDEWGNIPRTVRSTYPAESHTAFLTRSVTLNTFGDTVYARRFGRIDNTRVTYIRAGEPDVVRTSTFTYQPAGTALEGLLASEGAVAMDGAHTRTRSYRYDRFGNVSRKTSSAPGEPERYEDTVYDSTGRFPVSRSGDFQAGGDWAPHVIERVLARNAYGQPSRVEHLNGLVVSYSYDALGREIRRSENTGAALDTRYLRGGIAGAQYQIETSATSGAGTVEHFDALGRSIAQGKLGFDGRWIFSETEYDRNGRVKRRSAPHYAGNPAYWTTNQYDAFRLQSRSEPAAGGAVAVTSLSYDGLATKTTNALGQTRTEIRNAAQEPVVSIDHLGGAVRYGYDATGQVREVTTTAARGGQAITAKTLSIYDSLGRKVKTTDPDKGTWFYRYNGFDELVDQYRVIAGNGHGGTLEQALSAGLSMQRTHMQYDRRGRLILRADYRAGNALESTARWQYDTQENGVGQLAQDFIDGQNAGHIYGYDRYGRSAGRVIANDEFYGEEIGYDAVGRVATRTDAVGTGSGVRNRYNAAGYLESIEDLVSGTVLYRVRERDAHGHVASAMLGSGAISTWNHDDGSGHLLEQSTLLGKKFLQRLTYTWDSLGNPTSRWDRGALTVTNNKNLQQSFCYDGLNRLLKTYRDSLHGSCALALAQQDQQYDGFGNLVYKSGAGQLSYDTLRPSRLLAVADGTRYSYDSTGNVVADNGGRALDYTVFDKPASIRRLEQRIDFSYGVDRELRKRVDRDTTTGEITTTHRIGSVERVARTDGSYELRRYIGDAAIWTHRFDRSGKPIGVDKYYLHTDAQGSLALITGETGAIKQQFSYDAWGRRVWPYNPGQILPPTSFLPVSSQRTTAGFTGHDMLDAVGLVHMRGRIYDPRLGRFLQADPFVQAPAYLQSFNRYAYAFNTPIRFTDPTGFNGAGDDASTLGSSLGGWSDGTLLSTVYVGGSYGNTYTSFDASNGYGSYGGLAGFSFGSTVSVTPQAVSQFATSSSGDASLAIAGIRSGREPARGKSSALGGAFLPGEGEGYDTRMKCHTGICFVTLDHNIYLTGHRVRGVGPFHTALEYNGDDGQEWISAGFDGYTLEGLNRLVADIGNRSNGVRRSDAPSRNVALGLIIPPRGMTSDEYFELLKETTLNYRNLAEYDLFPGIADGYNSNSYIRGLLDVTGGTSSAELGSFVGGDKALPAYYFLREPISK